MSQGPREHIPDDLIDAFFDGELDDRAASDLFSQLPKDPARYEQVAKTQRMISLLADQEQAPDLTRNILREVDRRRGFLSTNMRRFVRIGRLAAAAVVLLAFLGIAAAQRYSPDTFRMKDQPHPVASFVEYSGSAAAKGCERLAAIPREVRAVISPLTDEVHRVAKRVDCRDDAQGLRHRKTHYHTARLEFSTLASAPSFSTGRHIASSNLALGSGGFDGRSVVHAAYFEGEPQSFVLPIGFVASIGPGTVDFSSPDAQEDPFGLPGADGLILRADFRFFRPWHSDQGIRTRRP